MNQTLELTKQLICCPSVTPNDNGCQQIISERLSRSQFNIEKMRFGFKIDLNHSFVDSCTFKENCRRGVRQL